MSEGYKPQIFINPNFESRLSPSFAADDNSNNGCQGEESFEEEHEEDLCFRCYFFLISASCSPETQTISRLFGNFLFDAFTLPFKFVFYYLNLCVCVCNSH